MFRLFLLLVLWLTASTPYALGQQATDSAPEEVHPLASKEEMIRDRFERFLDRVFRLQEQLSVEEPENAARLARVVERAGELGLAEQLDEIVRLLRDSPALTEALDAQERWVENADQLLAILLERDSDNEERKQQIEGLEAYRQKLQQILEREQELRDRTGKAAIAQGTGGQDDNAGQQSDDWDHQKEAENQRDVAEQTGGLAEKMRQDAASGKSLRGMPQPSGQPGSSPPGLQNLDQARRDMNDAAEKLEGDDPAKAGESQDRALEELKQAQKELEDVLNQLRREDREEALRDLEGRFREMLSKQNAINAATVHLHEIGPQTFRRAEKLQLADLSTQERVLSQRASVCGHVLDEEGTTIVFPRVVGQLAEDMGSAADRLAALDVGPITQNIEREIVETLEQLLEAVQRMQQENEQQAGSGGTDPENQPLLPPSAELKLLRSSQVRVNSRTVAIETARAAQSETPETLAGLLNTAAARQAQCAQIAQEMRDRQNRP
ncbi:MAG: hypothetical protein ACYTFA_00110 [Planctomycetota bacterium]